MTYRYRTLKFADAAEATSMLGEGEGRKYPNVVIRGERPEILDGEGSVLQEFEAGFFVDMAFRKFVADDLKPFVIERGDERWAGEPSPD